MFVSVDRFQDPLNLGGVQALALRLCRRKMLPSTRIDVWSVDITGNVAILVTPGIAFSMSHQSNASRASMSPAGVHLTPRHVSVLYVCSKLLPDMLKPLPFPVNSLLRIRWGICRLFETLGMTCKDRAAAFDRCKAPTRPPVVVSADFVVPYGEWVMHQVIFEVFPTQQQYDGSGEEYDEEFNPPNGTQSNQ